MKLYDFCVWHQDFQVPSLQGGYRWHTSYAYETPDPLEPASLSYVASKIVAAERVMMFPTTSFTHVVAYENDGLGLYDQNTVTHTITPLGIPGNVWFIYPTGLRGGLAADVFHGFNWRVNKTEGATIDGYLGGCIGMDDGFSRHRKAAATGAIIMRRDGPLMTDCWPIYRQILAEDPRIRTDVTIERFGYATQHRGITSGRLAGHITDNMRLRSKAYKPNSHFDWFNAIMADAMENALQGLRHYYHGMNTFSHKWGNEQIPNLYEAPGQLRAAFSVWHPLALALGYTINPDIRPVYNDWYLYRPYIVPPEPGALRVTRSMREIDGCLRQLFNCQQWLAYFYNVNPGVDPSQWHINNWKGQSYNTVQERVDTIYNDWDNFTSIIFRGMDALNVLNKIFLVKAAKAVTATPLIVTVNKLPNVKAPIQTKPTSFTTTWFGEIFAFNKDPYLTEVVFESTVRVPSAPPPEETYPWDSGNGEVEPDDEDWNLSFKNAIKAALAKLEFARQWVGRIRRQMPWYRSVPIEKIAPENDETKNPFTDSPVKPPKLPWKTGS